MRSSLRVLSVVFAAAIWSVPQTVRAQDERKALLDSLFFPEDFEIGFSISSDIFRPKPTVQDVRQLEQALKTDAENPHLHYLYAGALAREHKGSDALSEYAIAARGYGALAGRQALSGEQAVEWAGAVEQTGSINDAIEAAEQCLGRQPTDSILIHRYLVDGYSKAAMVTLLGVADVQAYDAAGALGAILATTDTSLRGNALKAQDCLQKARLHAEAAVADRAVAPIDLYNMSYVQLLAVAMDRMRASLDRPGANLSQSELLGMFQGLFKSPSMVRAFDMGRDDPRVQGVRPLWELTNEIDFMLMGQSSEDWPAAAQQALKRRLQETQDVIRRQGNPSAEAYESLATMLFMEDEWDGALDAARRALTLDPTQRNSFNISLLVFSDDGKWKDVEQWARKRAQVDHSALACGWVAIALAHQGKAEQVDGILDEAAFSASDKESDWLELIRGTAQLKQGETITAIGTLMAVLRHDQTNAVAAYNLAVAYYLSGHNNEALECLGTVTDHPPTARYSDELATQAALLMAKVVKATVDAW